MMCSLANQIIDVLIIGGGAAGLMCAIEAGRRGRSVVVLERSSQIGKKIRISGGGRCNFTNIHTSAENFLTDNPHFHKSALSRYTPQDFIALVERHRIAFHEKKLGQLFCNGSSVQIVDMLLRECSRCGVQVICSGLVSDVRRKKPAGFVVAAGDSQWECSSLVVATGGLSIPKSGATDFGYRIARQFGLRVLETRPGLVPLILDDPADRPFRDLSGVSLDAIVQWQRVAFRENVLFTHRGLSGPAILQISSYWKPGDSIMINARPDDDTVLPRRFLRTWHTRYGEQDPAAWQVVPTSTEGYAKAEVTAGGVDTRELSSKTMEALRVPGLYFIGEVVDVTGQLGGFNFQWAWASGFAAGQVV
jgi:predicted Rossmann fold flavoprotein